MLVKNLMTLTYFCDLGTHLNNELRPQSAYTAVVRLAKTATFLVYVYFYNFINRA